jgi:hypothetical protein
MLEVYIELDDSTQVIQSQIQELLAFDLSNRMRKVGPRIQNLLRKELKTRFVASEEYLDLMAGARRAHYGLDQPRARVDSIIDVWVNSLEVHTFPVSKFRIGKGALLFSINAIDASYLDVLRLPSAIVVSKGGIIPWLEWMLLGSSRFNLTNYHINLRTYQKNSRSGLALMIKGGTYQTPQSLLGSPENNWVTKVVSQLEPEIDKLVGRVLA